MATYIQLADLLESGNFKRRVRFAMMVSAAATLLDGGASAPLKAYARQILLNDIHDADLRRVTLRCVLDAGVQSAGEAATDAQIQAVVNVVFPTLA